MPYASQYLKYVEAEIPVSRTLIRPRNIYKIKSYKDVDDKTHTYAGNNSAIVFVIGIFDKKVWCIRMTDIRPVFFWNWLKPMIKKGVVLNEKIKKLEDLLVSDTKNGKKILPVIKDFINLSTDKIINITVQFAKGGIDKLVNGSQDSTNDIDAIEKLLKLTTTVSNTNMHLFNNDLKLQKYNSIPEIIDSFMNVRLKYYEKRKKYMIDELNRQLIKLSNKARFIKMCLSGVIDLRKKTNDQINELMEENEFVEIDDSYDYLIKIPMNSVSKENVERILKEEADKTAELELLIKTTLEKMWIDDLNELEEEYVKYKKCRVENQLGVGENTVIKKSVKKIK